MVNSEEWKICEDFPNYLVSISGMIKSTLTNKILKQSKLKTGYMCVGLRKEGKSYTVRVHRLIAKAFIPNPDNKPFIDHINGIRDDNRIENLRWCTTKENKNFELAVINNSKALLGRTLSSNHVKNITKSVQDSIGIKVDQYTLSGEYVKTFNSANEVQRLLGIWSANVLKCCKGISKKAGGYIWRYSQND